LSFAISKGMKIIPVSREEYSWKFEDWYHDELREKYGDLYIVPEGGANYYGVNGCMEIMQETDEAFDYVCVAAGTGTTAAGILLSLKEHSTLLAFPALKGGDFLKDEIRNLIRYTLFDEEWTNERMTHLQIITDYHFGGYAKYNEELIHFMRMFYSESTIKTDFIYTGKLFFGLLEMIRKDHFKHGTKILAIHTGGVQGNKGIQLEL
jgi:1-aminocyclopropane-1-carboxylate deaminase